jgi:hypothetical protein
VTRLLKDLIGSDAFASDALSFIDFKFFIFITLIINNIIIIIIIYKKKTGQGATHLVPETKK